MRLAPRTMARTACIRYATPSGSVSEKPVIRHNLEMVCQLLPTTVSTGLSRDHGTCADGSPIPPTGLVTAILSKPEIIGLTWGITLLTDGRDRDASWLAMLSHTSVTQMVFSSAESLATT